MSRPRSVLCRSPTGSVASRRGEASRPVSARCADSSWRIRRICRCWRSSTSSRREARPVRARSSASRGATTACRGRLPTRFAAGSSSTPTSAAFVSAATASRSRSRNAKATPSSPPTSPSSRFPRQPSARWNSLPGCPSLSALRSNALHTVRRRECFCNSNGRSGGAGTVTGRSGRHFRSAPCGTRASISAGSQGSSCSSPAGVRPLNAARSWRVKVPDGVMKRLRWLGAPVAAALDVAHLMGGRSARAWGLCRVQSRLRSMAARLLRRPAGRVMFAGEHTSLKWEGFMNGAIESGLRAAAEIRALATRPSTPS